MKLLVIYCIFSFYVIAVFLVLLSISSIQFVTSLDEGFRSCNKMKPIGHLIRKGPNFREENIGTASGTVCTLVGVSQCCFS